MHKTCEYYFAPQSPWAYLGHARFMKLAKKYDVQIVLKPCDLGKVFNGSGGLPLAKRPPQRQAYRLVELQRWRDYLGLPLNLQPKFTPVSGDLAARIIIATKFAHGTDRALLLTELIMRALWVEDKNIADAVTLATLTNVAELDGEALLKAAETSNVKNEYELCSNEAIAANVFGSPWYVIDGEPFWGQDRLGFVERALQRNT